MKGGYQIGNAALALAALETISKTLPVDGEAIRQGLLSVTWPGRLEYFCLADGKPVECPAEGAAGQPASFRRYLLDGAHNPAGVESLLAALVSEFHYDHLILVWACMGDKDVAATLTAIAPWRTASSSPARKASARPRRSSWPPSCPRKNAPRRRVRQRWPRPWPWPVIWRKAGI